MSLRHSKLSSPVLLGGDDPLRLDDAVPDEHLPAEGGDALVRLPQQFLVPQHALALLAQQGRHGDQVGHDGGVQVVGGAAHADLGDGRGQHEREGGPVRSGKSNIMLGQSEITWSLKKMENIAQSFYMLLLIQALNPVPNFFSPNLYCV